MDRAALEAEFAGRGREIAGVRGELLLSGSGWGALENARRARDGLPALSEVCRFPEAGMGLRQAPWLRLLETGVYPGADPRQAPLGYMIAPRWLDRLRAAPENWASKYQLGVALYAAGRREEARQTP